MDSPQRISLSSEPPPLSDATTHSLIDMDLCPDSILSPTLIPSFVDLPTHETAFVQDSVMASTQHRMFQEIFSIKNNQQQLKTELIHTITTLHQDLKLLNQEGQKKCIHTINQQFEYHRTQSASSVSWRLERLENQVKKDMEAIIKPLQIAIDKLQSDFLDQTQQIKLVSQELTSLKQDSINHTPVIPVPQPSSPIHCPSPARVLSLINPVAATNPVSASVVVNDAANVPYMFQSTMQQVLPDQGSVGPPDLFMTGGDISRRLSGRIPIKLDFPTFGRKGDDPDPLTYIEKCQDYLVLNPLSNEELTATLRNVLHGTARDWWNVARFSISTWVEFQTSFLSAFLSEDYVDELAERIRNRVQGENESIRDFAYMYYSLCRRWKPEIIEEEVIKLILKNINPSIASELRRRVSTVD